MVLYTPQCKHKNYQKLHFTLQKGAVCTHLTSSAASRDSAAKLTTDSYQLLLAHLNLRVTFQLHIRFARKVQPIFNLVFDSLTLT